MFLFSTVVAAQGATLLVAAGSASVGGEVERLLLALSPKQRPIDSSLRYGCRVEYIYSKYQHSDI
nr:hypothetical protein [Pseudomonas sp. P818]